MESKDSYRTESSVKAINHGPETDDSETKDINQGDDGGNFQDARDQDKDDYTMITVRKLE